MGKYLQVINVTFKRLLKLSEPVAKGLIEQPSKGFPSEGVIYSLDRVSVAKAYAAHKGHSGTSGGWIYNSEGRALAQGWVSYFNRFWYTGMQAWLKEERTKNAG